MKKHWKKILYSAVMIALAAVFVYSGYSLVSYYMRSRENQKVYDNLAQLVVDRPTVPLPPSIQSTEPAEEPTEPEEILITTRDPETGELKKILPEYAPLYIRNTDLVGWISIDGTKVNYPVVQSNVPDYYLKRNFEGTYSSHGCIYVSETADVFTPSDNVTLYGHRMGDDSMFGQLGLYPDKAFWEEHQYIRFDTLQQRHLYQVICVFAISAEDTKNFAYHNFVDAADAESFDTFVRRCMARSYYDTGITAQYGDKLITLSTCEYTQGNGRLVVVAKRIA